MDLLHLQLEMGEATGSDVFSEDASLSQFDRDDMEEYFAPGALDGFLGIDNNTQEGETQVNEAGETVTTFNIPQVLLQTLPIVNLENDTRITALTTAVNANAHQNTEQGVVAQQEPQPGTSGVPLPNPDEDFTLVVEAQVPIPVQEGGKATALGKKGNLNDIQVQPQAPNHGRVQPKKGLNTKNGPKKTQPQPQAAHVIPTPSTDKDDTGKTRLQLLSEIAGLIKSAGNGEMEVWGQYIGLKAARLTPGPGRDETLIDVEKRINRALYDEKEMEE